MLDAGKYFLKKQNRSIGIPQIDIIKVAIESLGLNQVKNFDPETNIIEYYLDKISNKNKKLIDFSARELSDEVLRESPAPGGGSVSSYVGSLGASLSGMVANLSCNTRGWEDKVDIFSNIAFKINKIREKLLLLVDEDSKAFNDIMNSFKLPKNNNKEKKIREKEIINSTLYAAEVPLKVMKESFLIYSHIKNLVDNGNQNSLSDSGVACLCVYSCIHGAYLNVRINLKDIENDHGIMKEAIEILKKSEIEKEKILRLIDQKI
tara:strand:- start:515 stop:1303 length:789 start_codon:yes stop_codon:yes gene_type:complete